MRKLSSILLLISVCLVGCGKGPNNIDPAFQPLYAQFIQDANAYGIDLDYNQSITIKFVDIEDDPDNGTNTTIGKCSAISYGNSAIQILPSAWDGSDLKKKMLMYHELGHCVLGLDHDSDRQHIMYYLIDGPMNYYPSHEDEVLSQFFSSYRK